MTAGGSSTPAAVSSEAEPDVSPQESEITGPKDADPTLTTWLATIGMPQYTGKFEAYGFENLSDLVSAAYQLEEEDFIQVGIGRAAHRKQILKVTL